MNSSRVPQVISSFSSLHKFLSECLHRAKWKTTLLTILLIHYTFTFPSARENIFYHVSAYILIISLWLASMLTQTPSWMYYFSHLVLSLFGPIYLMHSSQSNQTAFYFLDVFSFHPLFILLTSANFWYWFLSSLAQVLLLKYLYQPIFVHNLKTVNLDLLAARLTSTLCYNLVILGFVFYLQSLIMNKNKDKIRKLRISKKNSEEALSTHRKLLFAFSHEIRNPLNSIIGNLDLVLFKDMSDELREMVENIRLCSEMLVQYINSTLDVGKNEIGALDIKPTPISIHEAILFIWKITSQLMKSKGIQASVKVSKKIPPVLSLDVHRFIQILMNLIGNSIKFTESGSINIKVMWIEKPQVDPECFDPQPFDEINEGVFEKNEHVSFLNETIGNYTEKKYYSIDLRDKDFHIQHLQNPTHLTKGILKIIIKDTGCGMKQSDVENLFKQFHQFTDDHLKRKVGTGLGLYITKEIIEKMNGKVEAYSKEGKGSAFVFCIPTVYTPLSITPENEQIVQKLRDKRLRVLLVANSIFIQNILADYLHFLKPEELAIEKSINKGFEALVQYMKKGGSFDCVIISGKPKDTLGLCQKIRDLEKTSAVGTNILVIRDSYNGPSLALLAAEYRVSALLKRPLSFEDFLKSLQDIYKL